jgi:hypothetical protein
MKVRGPSSEEAIRRVAPSSPCKSDGYLVAVKWLQRDVDVLQAQKRLRGTAPRSWHIVTSGFMHPVDSSVPEGRRAHTPAITFGKRFAFTLPRARSQRTPF